MTESTPRRWSTGSVLRAVVGIALAVALLVWGLPIAAQTTWGAVWDTLSRVGLGRATLFALIAVVALWSYTFTMTGSLPGLRHRDALATNLAGSAAGNLLPGGGAVGAAATYAMYRSFGFDARQISTSLVVTGIWNVVGRMLLPIIGIGAVLGSGEHLPDGVLAGAASGVAVGLLLVVVVVGTLASERFGQAVAHALDRSVGALLRRLRHDPDLSLTGAVHTVRVQIGDVVRQRWLTMSLGLAGFFAVQFVLFCVCLRTTGVDLPLGPLFAAFALGRLLTSVGITPGGVGVTETGTAAALVAFGATPAPAAAGVVLFSIYTHVMEIPLGALAAAWWATSTGRAPGRRRPSPSSR